MASGQVQNWIKNLPITKFANAIKMQDVPTIRSYLSDPGFTEINLLSLADRRYPLEIAFETKNMEIIQLLLEHGADPKIPSYSDYLVKAIELKNKELVTLLLEKGADPTISNNEPLKTAVKKNETDIAALLLAHGAKITKIYSSPMIFYPIDNGNIEFVELLLQSGADPNEDDGDHFTPIIYSIRADIQIDTKIRIINLLLEYGANPSFQTSPGDTAMYFARRIGKASIINLLEEYGVDELDSELRSAIRYADIDDFIKILESGILPTQNDLWYALHFRNTQMVDIFLRNYDFKITSKQLLFACFGENPDLVKRLLKYGANVHEKVYENNSVHELAKSGFFHFTEINGIIMTFVERGSASELVAKKSLPPGFGEQIGKYLGGVRRRQSRQSRHKKHIKRINTSRKKSRRQ